MKYNIIIICFIYFQSSSFVFGQDSTRMALDINIINPGYGFQNTSISGQLSSPENLILSSNSTNVFGSGLIEGDFYPLKFIGVRLGIGFSQSNLNRSKIESEFQEQFDAYTVEFPNTNYENGVVPISGGFVPFYWHAGIIGKIELGKGINICPNLNYVRSFSGDSYNVYANFTDLTTSDQFRREYVFRENDHSGINVGVDFRYDPEELFYIGLRLNYIQLNTDGKSNYEDQLGNGSIFNGFGGEYSRRTSYFLFGVNFGIHIFPKGLW